MGYTLFSLGQHVRICSGDFAGITGVIASPTAPHDAIGTLNVRQPSLLHPVTVVVHAEDRRLTLRVAPELLERV